jgi:hypothetical protein
MLTARLVAVCRAAVRQALPCGLCLIVSLPLAHLSAQEIRRKAEIPKPAAAKTSGKKNEDAARREAARALRPSSGGQERTPWFGSIGVTQTTAEIMRRERALDLRGADQAEAEMEKKPPNRQLLPQNPLSPDRAEWPPRPRSARDDALTQAQAVAPALAQTLATNFTGATLAETSAFPPDSMGAVGPTQFLLGVNGRIKVFDKETGAPGPLNASMNAFFDLVRNGAGTSDPRVRYDRLSGRWFVLIINVALSNRVLLAVSDAGIITSDTVWTFFFFQQDAVAPAGDFACLADYPTLGIDAHALYIGVNQFCGLSLSYQGTTAFVVRKSSVLDGGPIVVSAFRNLTGTPTGSGLYTPQGVDNFDPQAAEGYFIGVDNASFGTLVLRRVSDPGGMPALSGNIFITVPATSSPLSVRHQGNNNGLNGQLSAVDDRLFDAHLRNGRLWTAHNIAVNNLGTASGARTRTGSRWYEIAGLDTATPGVAQSGTLFTASAGNGLDERNYWIPAVMVSGQGHMALTCSTAGSNEFINAAVAGRLADDPLGTLREPQLYTASAAAYNPPGDTGNARGVRRWGDYASVSLDPCDDMTMWAIQEFCDATNSYGVHVAKLLAPPPATPISANPPSVPLGETSVNVIITGAPADGAGFYDPGPGFACRLSVTVSGSVTVKKVTYLNPTAISLELSTVGATAGAQSVTVTNPDGQSVTAAGLLLLSDNGCAYTIEPDSQSFTASGGSGSAQVTAPNGCAWNAVSQAAFITIASGSSGAGNGVVKFSVDPNLSLGARTGTLTIAGQAFTLTQAGAAACSFSFFPSCNAVGGGGGSGSIHVTAPVGCTWSAVSNASWLTVTSGASGNGSGAVKYNVSFFTGFSGLRTGTISIAGKPYTVMQSRYANCAYAIAPTEQAFTAEGGAGSVAVTTGTCCNWTAASSASWITITEGSLGSGSGAVIFAVAPNHDAGPRTGTLTIAGQTFTITQAESGTCFYAIAPSSQSFIASGGAGQVSVMAGEGCLWTAASQDSFITITAGSNGAGSGTVSFMVAANAGAEARTGRLTIAGQTFTVTQAGAPTCNYAISPTNKTFSAAGGIGSFAVTAPEGCAWTAASSASWIKITAGSGNGDGNVSYAVKANPTSLSRSANITVGGKSFLVVQGKP